MIALDDLCVIERPVKSILESNFINASFIKICKDFNLSDNVKSFFKETFKAGFLCPRIEIKEKQTVFNFGIDHKYVIFNISNYEEIVFTYGTLGKKPKSGIINIKDKQLKTLSEFIFPKSKIQY